MRRIASLLILCAALAPGCRDGSSSSDASGAASGTTGNTGNAGANTGPSAPPPFLPHQHLYTDGRWIRDDAGGVVLLTGLNVAQAAKSPPYLSWQAESDYDLAVDSGFNVVRMLLQWTAVEPSPGVIDSAYLDQVRERLDWCEARGIAVVLDMHQDAYGAAVGGNGAPAWATFDDGWQSLQVPAALPWQSIYLQPRVMAAFESFWQNRTVTGTGLGLQDHYAQMWAAVAQQLGDHPAVVGYDLFNEPFYGTALLPIVWAAVQQLPGLLLAGLANGGNLSSGMLAQLADPASLYPLLDALEGPSQAFEKSALQPFLERCAEAVRAVDADKLILVEPAGLVGIGLRTGLEPLMASSGQPFGNIVFAQHYYDPIAETLSYDGETGRASEGLDRALANAEAVDAPLWLGEWGFIRASLGGHRELARDMQQLADARLLGAAYWDWHPSLDVEPFFPDLVRARAQRVAGTPTALSFDPATGVLELSLDADGAGGPTRLALPAAVYPHGYLIESGDAAGSWSWHAVPGTPLVDVYHAPGQTSHWLRVSPL